MKDFYVKKRYLFLSSILIIISGILLFLPEKESNHQISPESLLLEIIDDSRFMTTDEVAKMILNNDPSLQLIDLREPDEFAKFSLPGAINIPLKNILLKENADILNQTVKRNIFYSNGTIYSNQAWVLTKRLGYQNNYVMKGGLNEWVETILRPLEPKSNAPSEEFAKYEYRKAMSRYFGGNTNASSATTEQKSTTEKKTSTEKKKKKEGGGC